MREWVGTWLVCKSAGLSMARSVLGAAISGRLQLKLMYFYVCMREELGGWSVHIAGPRRTICSEVLLASIAPRTLCRA